LAIENAKCLPGPHVATGDWGSQRSPTSHRGDTRFAIDVQLKVKTSLGNVLPYPCAWYSCGNAQYTQRWLPSESHAPSPATGCQISLENRASSRPSSNVTPTKSVAEEIGSAPNTMAMRSTSSVQRFVVCCTQLRNAGSCSLTHGC